MVDVSQRDLALESLRLFNSVLYCLAAFILLWKGIATSTCFVRLTSGTRQMMICKAGSTLQRLSLWFLVACFLLTVFLHFLIAFFDFRQSSRISSNRSRLPACLQNSCVVDVDGHYHQCLFLTSWHSVAFTFCWFGDSSSFPYFGLGQIHIVSIETIGANERMSE